MINLFPIKCLYHCLFLIKLPTTSRATMNNSKASSCGFSFYYSKIIVFTIVKLPQHSIFQLS